MLFFGGSIAIRCCRQDLIANIVENFQVIGPNLRLELTKIFRGRGWLVGCCEYLFAVIIYLFTEGIDSLKQEHNNGSRGW